MKIALTADWHFRGKDLRAAEAQLSALISESKSRGVELVCVAGDIFDSANIHDGHASVGAVVAAIVGLLASSGLEWLMIPGNHDFRNNNQVDALAVLEGLHNVTVVRKHSWYRSHKYKLAVLCIPWDWSGADAATIVEALDADTPAGIARILLPHWQVDGMKLNAHRVHEGGGSWCVSRAFLELKSHRFDRIAGGDFHIRQPFYTGALRQLSFGEEGNPSGFEVFDTETKAVEWVELNAAPRYHNFVSRSPEDLTTFDWPEGDYAKIRIVGYTPDKVTVAKLQQDGAVVEEIPETIERLARAEEIPEGIMDKPVELLRVWAANQTPPVESIDELIEEFGAVESPTQAPVNGRPASTGEVATESTSPVPAATEEAF